VLGKRPQPPSSGDLGFLPQPSKRNKNNDGGDSDSDEDAALFNQVPAEPIKSEPFIKQEEQKLEN
jgi:hypothetical protein